ncbi:hypothetical protein SAMN05192555_112122 [Franzmannia pantelleriensis]|uniref:Uncharacterized protein n=1 Tax=Franzmannia pantelleriensis TaxID=48727 RepID=A0A1G9SUN0_9GAMM|nr:hypothetical protein [Halomonas pantelleriensis]SDM38555.1 hypothetical protein SAMN05192555_112122 [Halomonas pantelleriensis]
MTHYLARRLMFVSLLVLLGACAAAPMAPEPRAFVLPVERQAALAAGIEVLAERGYVIRHADVELGRADAVSAVWPGYRLRLDVEESPHGALISFSGQRGNRPLAPESLDRLLVELQAALGLAP